MSARAFDLVVFDWDGTLMDSIGHIVRSVRAAIAALDLPERSDEAIRDIIGLGLEEAVAKLYPEADRALRRRIMDVYREHYLNAGPEDERLYPGAEAVLAELHGRGYRLAVATGKSRRGLDRALAATGLWRYLEATRCADETRSKPHPQMLLELMAAVGSVPERTLMVGDTEYDLAMARAAGAHGLAAAYGVHPLARLRRHGPLGHVRSLVEVPDWLARHGVERPWGVLEEGGSRR